MPNIIISGKTGSGKSHYFKHEILAELNENQLANVVMIDTKNQHQLVGTKENKVKVVRGTTFMAHMKRKVWPRYMRKGRFRIKILPDRGLDYDARQAMLNDVCRFVSKKGRCWFVIEEMGWFVKSKVKLPVDFDDLIRLDTGEHNKHINVVIITQYPTDFSKEAFGAMSHKIWFYQTRKIQNTLFNAGQTNSIHEYLEEPLVFPAGYVGQYHTET